MAVVTLPLTFQNSFWSQDYRTGLEVLFTQLEKVRAQSRSLFHAASYTALQGIVENEEIVAFIKVCRSVRWTVSLCSHSTTRRHGVLLRLPSQLP